MTSVGARHCRGCGEGPLPQRARFCLVCGAALPEDSALADRPVEGIPATIPATQRASSTPPAGAAATKGPAAPTVPLGRPKGDVATDPTMALAGGSRPPIDASGKVPVDAHEPTQLERGGVSARRDSVADLAQPLPPVDDPLVGQTIAERYRVTRKLGAGGMGTVYLAEQLAVKRQVVLKFLHARMAADSEMTKRFHREALAVSKLSCPNTVIIHDYGQADDGRFFMAMEHLDGQTLGDVLRQGGAMSPLRVVALMLQVLESLAEAHDKGMVHRDLKPDNVMLVSRGGVEDFVKVLDFGIVKIAEREAERQGLDPAERAANARKAAARALGGGAGAGAGADADLDSGLTREGDIFGSPKYMAPEQIMAEPVDARADIYAIGVMLFEMLTGQPPFQADTLLKLLDKQVSGERPSLGSLRPEVAAPGLEALVRACLSREPDERPSSTAEVAEALRALTPELIARQEAQERRLLELAGIRRRWSRSRVAAAVLAPLVVALAAFIVAERVVPDDDGGGAKLAPGERVFVAASASQAPAWLPRGALLARGAGAGGGSGRDSGSGSAVGIVRDIDTRARALRLAQAEAVSALAGVPRRFDATRERSLYLGDLAAVDAHLAAMAAAARPRVATYWVKLAAGGKRRVVYDGYARVSATSAAKVRALARAFADMRYLRYGMLLDRAARQRRCPRARALHATLDRIVGELPVKKKRRKRLRFLLRRRLGGCAPAAGSGSGTGSGPGLGTGTGTGSRSR